MNENLLPNGGQPPAIVIPAHLPQDLERVKQQFAAIGRQLSALRLEVGRKLNQARQDLGEGMFGALRQYLEHDLDISWSYQDVAMRLALGEIPPTVIGVIPDSKLRNMESDVFSKSVLIMGENQVPVTKRVEEMTKEEAKRCISAAGHVRTLSDQRHAEAAKAIQTLRATRFEVDGEALVLTVPGIDKLVSLKITQSLLDQIAIAL